MAGNFVAAGAPGAAASTNNGLMGAIVAFRQPRPVQSVANGAVSLAGMAPVMRVSGKVIASEWPHNYAVHSQDVAAAGLLFGKLRGAAATALGEIRGDGPNEVPSDAVLMAMYLAQANARYMINIWASNPDENFVFGSVDLAAGTVALAATLLVNATASGLTAPGGGALAGLGAPLGSHRAGEAIVDVVLTAPEIAMMNMLIADDLGLKTAAMGLSVVAMQLATDGHHYISANAVVQALLAEHDSEFQKIASAAGASLPRTKSCLVHKALHSIPANQVTAFATQPHAPTIVNGWGLPRIAVRFPLDTPEGHAASAKLAVVVAARSTMATLGGASDLHVVESMLTWVNQLDFAAKNAALADITLIMTAVDGPVAFLAGFLQGWADGSSTKFTSLKAKSIARLSESHASEYAIGKAQGASAWKAFRSKGVSAVTPQDAIAPPNFSAANTAAINAAVFAMAPAVVVVPRAPATEARIDEITERQTTLITQWQAAAAVAQATGNPVPLPPAPADYGAAF